jgi:hypothetical protein
MEFVIKRCGRFDLCQSDEGFWWTMASHAGDAWFWDPAARQWTPACRISPTAEKATAGLDWTLAHEQLGDLDHQHPTCPGHFHP